MVRRPVSTLIDNHMPLSLYGPNYEADQYVGKRRERTVAEKKGPPGDGINRALRRATPLKTGSRSELRKKTHPEINERPLTLVYRRTTPRSRM